MALTNADESPAPHRWLSTKRFDFGEARFHGDTVWFSHGQIERVEGKNPGGAP